jgi:hypothetical protein
LQFVSTPLLTPYLFRIKHLHLRFNIHTLLLLRRLKSTVLASIWISRPGTARHRLATIRCPRVHRLRVLARPRVNADINRSIQAICNRLANQADLHDGVIAALFAHVEEGVLGVEGLSLLVGVVGRRLFNLAEEVLLDVELADVRNCAALDSVVGEELGAVVDDGYAWSVKIVAVGCGYESLLWRWLARPT